MRRSGGYCSKRTPALDKGSMMQFTGLAEYGRDQAEHPLAAGLGRQRGDRATLGQSVAVRASR